MAEFMIGRWTFRTKGEARRAVSETLQRQPLDTPLEGDDDEFIRSLLDLHPGGARKKSGGVREIVVRVNKIDGLPPQRGFWIVHDDGTTIDFGINACLRTHAQNVKAGQAWAARCAVQPTMLSYKRSYFAGRETAPCEVGGKPITWDEADVHHAGDWPFERVLAEWLNSRDAAPDLIDVGITKTLAPSDAADFIAYHDARVILQVVDKQIHMRLKWRNDIFREP